MWSSLILLAAVVVGTWNGNWFPSGRAEHRAHPDVEAATISATAKMLARGLNRADPGGTNDVILCLCEIRNPEVASNLVEQIGRKGLRVVIVSRYRRRDRFDQQQNVIATTLPVAETHWSKWKPEKGVSPPRGYAYAAVVVDPATTAAVYAVHLKANYGATTPKIRESNRAKRTAAIRQLVGIEATKREKDVRPVVIAGDMNADKWNGNFADEELFDILEHAGFDNFLSLLPPSERGTHPSVRYGDSALDYVFSRGLTAVGIPFLVPADGLSDHNALFVTLRAPLK